MEQKPSEITTTGQSVIVQDQTQTEVTLGEEHSESIVNGQGSASSYVKEPEVTEGHKEEQQWKPQTQAAQDHEYTGENYQNEYESYNEEHGKFDDNLDGYDPRDFEKFNDVEPNQDSEIVSSNFEEKVVIEQKPISNTSSTKLQEQPVKKVQTTKAATNSSSQKKQVKSQQKPVIVEKKPETAQKQQSPEKQPKKKSKKKKIQQSEPLPVISANSSQGRKQIKAEIKKQEMKKVESGKEGPESGSPQNNKNPQPQQKMSRQQVSSIRVSQIKEVSSIIVPNEISAGEIIFQAQRQRIGTTLDLFFKYTAKHEKHTTNQKQLITNVEDEVQKRRLSKTPLMNTLRDYFDNFVSLCKELYERSYKFAKSDKEMSANPMINMREELKSGIDEMIFLRKSTGNEYNRLGEFIGVNVSKNVVKLFTEYWKAIGLAETKHKEKKQEFARKQKQFSKRINKVVKVYTKGKQGSSQQEDLFIEMIKFINQEKQYRTCLIEYGMGLVPLKKAFIKAEQTLYEELQVLFNTYKNQFRGLFSIHPKEFTQIEKMQKLIKENSTFEKLSDITDSDYVRSVLITLEKGSVQNLTDREFEKVLNMLHFEEIVGNTIELLKGTTTKSFELKTKAQQVVDTVSGNLLIFNKQTAQMKEKFIIKNIDARIVQQGVIEIDQTLKGIIFDSHRTVRITFRDNDRAEELICFLNQVHENIKQQELANSNKK